MESAVDQPAHPLGSVNRDAVVGALKAAGFRDPDVLLARKTEMAGRLRTARTFAAWLGGGGALALLAALASPAGLGAVAGVPLRVAGAAAGLAAFVFGAWLRRRASRNLATLEAGFAEYARSAGVMILVLVGAIGGCGGGDSNPAGPDGKGPSAMTARIDGAEFASDPLPAGFGATLAAPGTYVLGGQQVVSATSFRSITITLSNIAGPGTYPLGVGPSVFGGTGIVVQDGAGWGTPLSGSAGTVTITELTAARMAGTFSFTAAASAGGATGTKTVTEGKFDYPVVVMGTVGPLPEHAGNRFEGRVGGADWTAATVVANDGLANTLICSASNSRHTLSFTLSGYAGPDPYELSMTAPVRMVVVMGPGESPMSDPCCWNALSGNTGTITITNETSTRIQGTIDAILAPGPGTNATETMILEGVEFDLGRTP